MIISKLFILVESLCIFVNIRSQSLNETLVLVHVLFRHGDRTPDLLNLYPSNPYYGESNYAPFGYGQLTNVGKLKAYKVGTDLRRRYTGFLDETYNINLIEPRSSDFNRTKQSLQVMLAGLFPPTKELVWLEGFNWQPISFNYVERQYDKELFCYGCPNWDKSIDQYLKSADGQSFTAKYDDTFKYISENTGENITDILQVYYMYFGFLIQEELNFTLPEWTRAVYPYPMRNITTDYYALMFSTKNLKKMSAGYLLKKIIIDTQNRIDGNFSQRKMYIYSAHENNIASVLKIFDIWNDEEIAAYGSYVLIELHEINGIHRVKLFYQNYTTNEPILLKLPTCEEFCPFERFVSIANEFVPEDDSICGKVSSSSGRITLNPAAFKYIFLALQFVFLYKLSYLYI